MNEIGNINNKLKQIIFELRNRSGGLDPLFDRNDCLTLDSFTSLVKEVDASYSEVIDFYKGYLSNVVLNDATESFNRFFQCGLSGEISWENANKSIIEIVGISVNTDEINWAKKSPRRFVQSKIDYTSEKVIHAKINSLVSGYDLVLQQNLTYIKNKHAFILTKLLLENVIEETLNPIGRISNDYSYFESFFGSKKEKFIKNSQYSKKYKLIAIANGIEIIPNVSPARIYDSSIDTTIFLSGIEDYLLGYLSELSSKFNFDLSLKPSSLYSKAGKFEEDYLAEQLEVGRYFDISNFNRELISKLYSDEYDNFWIKIDNFNITFEEILQDVEQYDDMYITQVIHAEYTCVDKILFVTHLDHEFIFYTSEEFKRRQSNPSQKGEAQKRIKTFKIDNSEIPITDENNILLTRGAFRRFWF